MFNVKTNKSYGYDMIHPRLLKDASSYIISPLTHIFNLSITLGKLPNKMKIAKIVPIFKLGDPTHLGNYRPISVLSGISKLLERITAKIITFSC